MKISIGICTKDNQSFLVECLNSIVVQKNPSQLQVEILIIDSSSQSRLTQRLLHQINFPKNFKLKYFFESSLGISFARNFMFTHASGDILFVVDDDVIVDKNWLKNGLKIFSLYPQIGLIGGKISLLNKIPSDFVSTLKLLNFSSNFWPYTLYDLGEKNIIFTENLADYPCFANLAVRRSIYKQLRLDTSFANQQSWFKVFGGEDPEYLEQVKCLTSIMYVPSMHVFHHLKPHKFSRRFLHWRYREHGKEVALLKIKHHLHTADSMVSFTQFIFDLKMFLKKTLKHQDSFKESTSLLFIINYYLTLGYFFFFRHWHNFCKKKCQY